MVNCLGISSLSDKTIEGQKFIFAACICRVETDPRDGSTWSSAQGSGPTLTQTEGYDPIAFLAHGQYSTP